jgi:hypothetical protein
MLERMNARSQAFGLALGLSGEPSISDTSKDQARRENIPSRMLPSMATLLSWPSLDYVVG